MGVSQKRYITAIHAVYVREYTFDLSKVRPVVAKPDFVDNVVPAEETCGIKINEAFLGSCNNGRIEDLRVGAEVIKGKKVAEGVRFPGCSCKPDHLSSGIKGGAYRYLHGSRSYCYERIAVYAGEAARVLSARMRS